MSDKNGGSLQNPATDDSLRLIIDTTPAFIHTALPDGALDFLNQGWLGFVGVPLTNLLGWRWTSAIHPEDVEEFVDKWRAAIASGEPFVAESRVRRADGKYRWFLHRKVPLRDETGKIVKWYGSSLEIEERKWAEEELRRSEAYLSEAQRLSHTGSFGWDVLSGDIYWSDETFRIYELEPKIKITTDLILQRTHPDDRLAVQQLIERASSERTEFALEHRLLMPDGSIKYLRVVGRPLKDEGRRSEFVGAVTDITDHKQAQESLRESESYLSEAQKLSHTGSWAWSPEKDIRYWSEECYRVLSFDPQDGLPRFEEFFQRIHPDDQPGFRELIQTAIREKAEWEADYRIVHADGRIRDIHVLGHPILDTSGHLVEFVGTVIDVTDRKRADEALRASERKYRHLVDTTPAFIHTASPDGALDFLSLGWLEYGGLTLEDLKDWRWTAAIHPEDVEGFVDKWRAALASGEPFEAESRVRRADGEYRWFLQRNVPLRDETGEIVKWYGTGIDIEERKQAEFYLAEGQRLAHMGSWAFNAAGFDYWSSELFRIHGLDPNLKAPTVEEYMALVHPEDREFVAQAIRKMLADNRGFDFTKRIVRPNAEIRRVRCVGIAATHGGTFQGFVGTGMDVTEQERLTDELRRSEYDLRERERELRQILDFTPQHIGVFGPDGTPLYANQAALEYFGVTIDEWRAEASRLDHVHPDDCEHFLDERKNRIVEGAPHELEARLLRHDGQFRWFLIRRNPVKDERGQIVRWYSTGSDIEDRKRAEEEIRKENIALREEILTRSMFEEIVGASHALQTVLSRISKVAPSDSTVLITGETGTGKELVARAIHRRSGRASRAFVGVNCAAVPRDLIASELFGHEKGAFTGATQQRLGRFELANGGTIFLDEVGELPTETQIALLRVLQEHEFERVGGTRRIRADVRVIAATNRDLQAAIRAGSFRSDLFYRLNVFPIEIPALRERREDIPVLVEYFIGRYARKAGKNITRVNKKTLELLQSYPWPGNIRELQNVIERSVILCETEIFSVDESWLPQPAYVTEPGNETELSRRLLAQEKEMIEAALKECRGRVFGPSGAADKLGIPRSTLESKIRKLKIDKNRFKAADPS